MIITAAAPVSRTTTAAPGDQPLSSSALAKEPETPNEAAESNAIPSPAAVDGATGVADATGRTGLVAVWDDTKGLSSAIVVADGELIAVMSDQRLH